MLAVVLAVLVPAASAKAVDGDTFAGFSGDGLLISDFGGVSAVSPPRDAVRDASGRLVVVGTAGSEIGVARINPSGTLDGSFGGGDGKVILDSGATTSGERAQAVAIDGDGKIVLVGRAGLSGASDLVLARLESDGDYDETFDGPNGPGNGIFRLDFATFDEPIDIAMKGTKIVVGATQTTTTPVPAITQLNAGGTADSSFGGGDGTFSFSFPDQGGGSFLFSIAVQPDGMILGSGGPNGSAGPGVARIKADGSSLDTTGFNPGGAIPGLIQAPAPSGYFDMDAVGLALGAGGEIVVGGTASRFDSVVLTDVAVARFTAAGVLDSGFGSNGYRVVDETGDQFGAAVALQPNGAILLGGGWETATDLVYDPAAARFTSGGALDAGFSPGGVAGVATPSFGQDMRTAAIALSTDGIAYLVGPTRASGGFDKIGIAALIYDTQAATPPPGGGPGAPAQATTPAKKCKKGQKRKKGKCVKKKKKKRKKK